MAQRAYLVLVRLFFSYTRRISVKGKPDTTLELVGLASLICMTYLLVRLDNK